MIYQPIEAGDLVLKCLSSDPCLIKLCEQINALARHSHETGNRIIELCKAVDNAMPDPVGHGVPERAVYA